MTSSIKRLSIMLIAAAVPAMSATESQACWWWGCYRPVTCCYQPCCYRPCCPTPCACGTSPCSCPSGGCSTGNCASGACSASLTPSAGYAFLSSLPVQTSPTARVRTVAADRTSRKLFRSDQPVQARRTQRPLHRVAADSRPREAAETTRRSSERRNRTLLDARLMTGSARG